MKLSLSPIVFSLVLTALVGWIAPVAFGEDGDLACPESLAPIMIENEFIFESAPFPSCHASTIAETPDGALVAAWFGGSAEGKPDVGIWLSRKDPGGKWTAPIPVASAADDQGGIPCWNPVLFQWRDGPLVLFYKVSRTIPTWHGEMIVSRDGGKTWGEKSRLPEHFIGPVKNKPIQLADGTFLAGSSEEGLRSSDVADDYWRIHVERSAGFGKTWSRTAALNRPGEGGAIQPSILTYPDGRLQMICRNQRNDSTLWQIWSEDGGQTWGELEPLSLPNPCSGTDAVTLADGRQLLVYNHTTGKRGGRGFLNVAISENGRDWFAVATLEKTPEQEFSYPAVIQTKDGLVHITYTWRRERIKQVVIDPSKFSPVEIIEGNWPSDR